MISRVRKLVVKYNGRLVGYLGNNAPYPEFGLFAFISGNSKNKR